MPCGPRVSVLDLVVACVDSGKDTFLSMIKPRGRIRQKIRWAIIGEVFPTTDLHVPGCQPRFSCFWLLPPLPVDAWFAEAV